jgi:hypothetical protein
VKSSLQPVQIRHGGTKEEEMEKVLNVEEIKKKIEDHFAKITKEELEKNLIKAGINIYTDRDLDFLDGKKS